MWGKEFLITLELKNSLTESQPQVYDSSARLGSEEFKGSD